MKFLIIEDDDQLSGALIQVLTNHHYLVDRAMDGEMGKEMAEVFPYDLILLDWMLPKLDGIQTCQQLRATGNNVPIILMTARDAGTDKVAGLDAGADDYLIKPFEFEELLARIRALLRRAEGIVSPVLQWGELCLDPRSAEVSYRDVPISLTPKEYGLLELFLRNPNRVFSLDDLLDKIWPFEDAPHISAVRTQVKGLRQKLKRVGLTDVIETLYGLGYRLVPADLVEHQAEKTVDGKDVLPQSSPSMGAKQIDLKTLWQPVREPYMQRVSDLATMLNKLQPGSLNEVARQQIVRETHALAGSLGSFGFPMVAAYCQEIENSLLANSRLTPQHVSHLEALVTNVQQALTSSEILPGSAPMPKNLAQPGTLSSATLLIVDNDPAVLTLLHNLLQPWGFQLQLLSKPQHFFATLEQTAPDLVILDVDMPEITGFDLCQLMRNDSRWLELPVLLLSAHTEAETIQRVFSVGGDDYVRKPIVAPELVVRILNWLERARTRQLQTNIDSLTGIANRQKSTQDLSRFLRLGHRQEQPLCFALLNFDSFKPTNNEMCDFSSSPFSRGLGGSPSAKATDRSPSVPLKKGDDHPQVAHAVNSNFERASDQILQRFGERLGIAFRVDDVAARWSKTEFVVGLYGASREEGTQRLTQFLQAWQNEQLSCDNQTFQGTFTVGIAVYPEDARDLQGLYRSASTVLSQTNVDRQ
ncbi:response regulator [Leptolyngbya cf. ectocarpi LEGE 11479]|uniref:Response regulator n=1 Tax=Leptolyngbya cf. ectocarpi LEGE 11479 TaxID=1828722 RepID=A0A928ZTF3_LEPEC|nr:response regulator [Leptolyngbya ectocarpi]MBE9067241.1 response regulator [Leptolyngbya cf. ectocarpi LEGE 11479]